LLTSQEEIIIEFVSQLLAPSCLCTQLCGC